VLFRSILSGLHCFTSDLKLRLPFPPIFAPECGFHCSENNCKLSLEAVTKYICVAALFGLWFFLYFFSDRYILSCGCCGLIERPDFARFAWLQLCLHLSRKRIALELNYITTLQCRVFIILKGLEVLTRAQPTREPADWRLKPNPNNRGTWEHRRSRPKLRDICKYVASREQSTTVVGLCAFRDYLSFFPWYDGPARVRPLNNPYQGK